MSAVETKFLIQNAGQKTVRLGLTTLLRVWRRLPSLFLGPMPRNCALR